jgi:GntR family transcriptional regulator
MPNSGDLSKRPLYLQVHDWLARQISSGVWKPGVFIPNEQDLAKQLGVSTGTMRKALDQLEAERLLVRKQGRGTFVVDHASGENLLRFINLRASNGERIVGIGEILAQSVRTATAEEREQLELDAAETVVATKRLRRHAERPLSVEERCLAVSRFPGLAAREVGDYGIMRLAQKCGLIFGQAIEKIRLAEATPEHADLLDTQVGSPLLRLDRLIYSAGSKALPVERRIAFCHLGDDMFYAVEMH